MSYAQDVIYAQVLSQLVHLGAQYAPSAHVSIQTLRGEVTAEFVASTVSGFRWFSFPLDFSRAMDVQLEALENALADTWHIIQPVEVLQYV